LQIVGFMVSRGASVEECEEDEELEGEGVQLNP
jgi:hypothetical protein